VKNKMKNFKFIIFNIFVIIHTVFIFAYAAEVKNTAASGAPSSAAPAIVQPQIQQQVQAGKMPDNNYKYYPLGKPDPFHPFVEVGIASKKKEEKKVSVYPLERDEIEKFKLAGIIGDPIKRLAIVEIMEEGKLKFYPLLRGTHIGLHKGKVLEIMADRVIVEETDKSKKTKRIILKLYKDNEVEP
jgi:type IV pilus assembly protein PilP